MNAIRRIRPELENRKQRHLRICDEMTELGMELLRNLTTQARRQHEAQPKQSPTTHPDDAFALLAESICETIALEIHLANNTEAENTSSPEPRRRIRQPLIN